jgi:hypothetical protein
MPMQAISRGSGLITKVQVFVFASQSQNQFLHTIGRGVELAHIPDLTLPARIGDGDSVPELRDIDPNIDFLWRGHDPSSIDEDRFLTQRSREVSQFGRSEPFLCPGLLSKGRCAQPRSSMAAGQPAKPARSVLDGGEHDATPEQVGDLQPGLVRSSWERTCGLTVRRSPGTDQATITDSLSPGTLKIPVREKRIDAG